MTTRKDFAIKPNENRITLRAFLLGLFFAAVFIMPTVRGHYFWKLYTSTQIPILPYFLLIIAVALVNPFLNLVRVIRPFSAAELLIVFIMGMVPAGLPTMGLTTHLVPIMANLHERAWNNQQSQWDRYVEPHINEGYFLSEPGTRARAQKLLEADTAWQAAKSVYHAAKYLRQSRDELAAARQRPDDAVRIPDPAARRKAEQALRRRLVVARNTSKAAEAWWERFQARYDPGEVLRTFPAKIETLKAETERCKKEFDDWAAADFEKVAEFRRGLPSEMRAIPGFVYDRGEGLMAYLERLRRFLHGTSALRELERADALLAEAARAGRNIDGELADRLRAAIAKLEPISDLPTLAEQWAAHEAARELLAKDQAELARRLRELHRRRRYIHAERADALEQDVADVQARHRQVALEIRRHDREIGARIRLQLVPVTLVWETRLELEGLLASLEAGAAPAYPCLQQRLWEQMDRFRSFDASLPRYLVGDVPWTLWLRPVANWAALILVTYLVLMTFNILIFRQWAHNEQIVYPLAELPATLAGVGERPGGRLPAVFRSGLFWTGLGVSFSIIGWNQFVAPKVPGIEGISLAWQWAPYVQGSVLDALRPFCRFEILFILIGLTFLVPARISGSLWGFQFFYMAQLLVIVWLGYGVHEQSFPTDPTMTLNFRTAQGGGALVIFAGLMFWRCRKYMLCAFRPSAVKELDPSEQRELRGASFLFWAGSVTLVLLLHLGLGASLFYSILYYVLIMIVTVGLIRATAEGGFLGLQCFFGPFHFIRSVFGMNHSWSAPALFAPLFIFHSVMFLEYKVFIAPMMANALKIRDKLGLQRFKFHATVAFSIVFVFALSMLVHITRSYDMGVTQMGMWFSDGVPGRVFQTVKMMVVTNPVDTAGGRSWLLVGAGLMLALLTFRRRIFWLPHPIGLIMLMNPLMDGYWFSIFLGWTFKVLVSKYGDKNTYVRFRFFFIGLIVGEILAKGYTYHVGALDSQVALWHLWQ